MNYFRSIFFNFLAVFLINRVSPGLQIVYFEQVPNVITDLLFSLIVGFLNATVFPFLSILELNPNKFKLAFFTAIISYGAFLIVSIAPFGVQVTSPLGILVAGTFIWFVAFFTNYLEFKSFNCR